MCVYCFFLFTSMMVSKLTYAHMYTCVKTFLSYTYHVNLTLDDSLEDESAGGLEEDDESEELLLHFFFLCFLPFAFLAFFFLSFFCFVSPPLSASSASSIARKNWDIVVSCSSSIASTSQTKYCLSALAKLHGFWVDNETWVSK